MHLVRVGKTTVNLDLVRLITRTDDGVVKVLFDTMSSATFSGDDAQALDTYLQQTAGEVDVKAVNLQRQSSAQAQRPAVGPTLVPPR